MKKILENKIWKVIFVYVFLNSSGVKAPVSLVITSTASFAPASPSIYEDVLDKKDSLPYN